MRFGSVRVNSMKEYCEMWNLKINASKTKILVFSRGKIRNKPTIYFGNDVLEVVYVFGCGF